MLYKTGTDVRKKFNILPSQTFQFRVHKKDYFDVGTALFAGK